MVQVSPRHWHSGCFKLSSWRTLSTASHGGMTVRSESECSSGAIRVGGNQPLFIRYATHTHTQEEPSPQDQITPPPTQPPQTREPTAAIVSFDCGHRVVCTAYSRSGWARVGAGGVRGAVGGPSESSLWGVVPFAELGVVLRGLGGMVASGASWGWV